MASAAEVVKFTVASKSRGEDRAFFEELLRKENPAQPPANAEEAKQYLTLDNLFIGRFDLNDDGVPELFVSFQHSYVCGSFGCDTRIYQRLDRRWDHLTTVSMQGGVFVLDERIGGWRSLCASEHGVRWGKDPRTGQEEYLSFCISKQCAHELEEDFTPENMPPYHRGNSAPLCKDSPVSKKFG